MTKEEKEKLYIICEMFDKHSGCPIFFEHINNLWLSSILGLNKARHDAAATLITDDYFRGGLDAINFIQDQISEYAHAKEMSAPTKA